MTDVSTRLDQDNLAPEHVLVIGADPRINAVASVSWKEYPNMNIKDFHLVVVCLASAEESAVGHGEVGVWSSAVSGNVVDEFLNAPQKEIVFIGPDLPSGWQKPIYDTVPYLQPIRLEAGRNITDIDPEFSSYMSQVATYTWTVLPGVRDPQKHTAGKAKHLALAAGSDIIAASYRLAAASRIVVLPTPTECDLQEGVRILLKMNYGIRVGPSPRPDWLEQVSLPRIESLRKERDEAAAELSQAQTAMERVDQSLEEAEQDLAILYEQGEILEGLVRRVLRDLAADVTDPEIQHAGHDGTLVTPGGARVVLEIKGVTGLIGLAHVRQLDQWVTDLMYEDEDEDEKEKPGEWKGILVANARLALPPDARGDPYAPNARDFAGRRGHALITTTQLIEALEQVNAITSIRPIGGRRLLRILALSNKPGNHPHALMCA